MHKTIPSHIFKEKLSQRNTILIDVRTWEEQEKYWVISEKQLHINASKEPALEEILKLDKNKTYLIYCWHWVRSRQVLEYIKNLWFEEVYDLEGGIDRWKN